MRKISKILTSIIISTFLIISYSNLAIGANHPDWQEIKKIRKEIIALGAEPIKRKGLQGDSKLLKILQKQLKEVKEEIKKEEEKRKKIEAAKKELIKELEALGGKPEVDTSDIDTDKEIIALRKQIQDIKDKKESDKKKIEEEKKKAEDKKKEEKKQRKIEAAKKELIKEIEDLGEKPVVNANDIDSDEDVIALKKQLQEIKDSKQKEQTRTEVIETIKNELIFLGVTPISEYEFGSDDEYIASLRKQIEDAKIKNKEEEQKLKDSIPDWYGLANMPKNTDTIMYAKGTHTSADLDQSELIGLEKAKAKLASNLASIMSLKIEIATSEKVVDVDSAFKQEITSISKSVAKEVSIGGYKTYKSVTKELSNGKFRNYIIIEFPVSVAYKAFLEDIKNNPATKNNIKKIKDTDAFKELEALVTGA